MGAAVANVPRGTPDGPAPPFPMRVLDRWDQFLGTLRTGAPIADAMQKHYMTRADIEACCEDPHRRQAYNEARHVAKARTWSVFDFEEIFERIMGGMGVAEAIEQVKPGHGSGPGYTGFLATISRDPVLKDQYRFALEAASLHRQDELIAIADDKSGDVLHQDKGPVGNTANVNRSKLQVDTRYRLMAAWNRRVFGEEKHQTAVQVNVNYAAQLEEARARARTGKPTALTKAEKLEAVEAIFTSEPEAKDDWRDTSWLDANS